MSRACGLQGVQVGGLRKRANASYRLLVSGALPVGALLGGFLGAWIGLQLTLLVGALGLLSTWLWIMFSPVPRLQRLPTMSDKLSTSALEKPAHNWHKRARIVDK